MRSVTSLIALALVAPLLFAGPAGAGGPEAASRQAELGTCPAGQTCVESGVVCDPSNTPCTFDFLPRFLVGKMVIAVDDDPPGADPSVACNPGDDKSTVTFSLRAKKKAAKARKKPALRKRTVRLSHVFETCASFGNVQCGTSELLCSREHARIAETAVPDVTNLGFQVLPEPIASDVRNALGASGGAPVITSVVQTGSDDHSGPSDPLPTVVTFDVTIMVLQ